MAVASELASVVTKHATPAAISSQPKRWNDARLSA